MSLKEIFGDGPCVIVGFVIDGEEQLMRLDFDTSVAAREAHEYLRAKIDTTNGKPCAI